MGNCFGLEPGPEPPQEDLVQNWSLNKVSFLLYQEARRQRQAEAALRRQKEVMEWLCTYLSVESYQNESKGVKNPNVLKTKQERKEAIEKRAEDAERQHGTGGGGLKVF